MIGDDLIVATIKSWNIKNFYKIKEDVVFHMTRPSLWGRSPLQNLVARGVYGTKISAIKVVGKSDTRLIHLKKTHSYVGVQKGFIGWASDAIFKID